MTNKPDIIYEQNCQEFRSLNGFFWQIPLIMMTLNGGLWYSVASLDLAPMAQRGVLWFAAFANLVMIMGLWRLRSVMQDLLDAIHAYQGTQPPGRAKFIQYLFQVLLFWAAAGALIASSPSSRPVIPVSGSTACAARVPVAISPAASISPGMVMMLSLARPPHHHGFGSRLLMLIATAI
jgi:hypothetical protein